MDRALNNPGTRAHSKSAARSAPIDIRVVSSNCSQLVVSQAWHSLVNG
jgi:hypothetical protein